ncbi:ABC transporter permease [Solwaraspora sp. WMMD1047]|uniref:ABC transporter permease subunit n=1 Tax=Solwaraspora sp. WMMD1047 TaxID=3016102 RepID=UPI002415F414|nr:ABC transporter permease subunit [Solwaraspora sp. WMMD1047]MDG4829369.1 ABC transporter permease [Solwaraspora sp. WMMD1047]
MNLIRAEVGRLTARRFVQVMVLLLIGAFGITIATTIAGSHAPTGPELARAEAQAAETRLDAERWYADCLAAQRSAEPSDLREKYPRDCDDLRPARIDAADFLYGVFVFDRQIRPLVYFLVTFLALFGFLVGASYIGADLNSGGMTNLLLWRPSRLTVLGGKLGTLLAGVLLVSLVAAVLYLGAFWTIAQVGGLPGNTDGEFWGWLALTVGRGFALILMTTAAGFAIATLGGHTAAALGTVAGYAVLWEAGARIVMEIVEAARPDQWMLSTYVITWMTGETSLWDQRACRGAVDVDCTGAYTITWVPAALVLLAVTAGAVGTAFAVFRRRDLA